MRKKYSIINGVVGVFSKIALIISEFILRSIFLAYLGIDVVGINGVFLNLLTLLQLSELGIGGAITFNLYKPLVENNFQRINIIMNIYKKLYYKIAVCILFLGIILMYFLPNIINESNLSINYIKICYIIYLIGCIATYFLCYKRTLLLADQKQYIVTIIDFVINIIFIFLKLYIIIKFKSYLFYLIVHIFYPIISNIIISLYCNKNYKYLNSSSSSERECEKCKKEIFYNVKDIIFSKLAGYIHLSTDNLIISSFIGISEVGYLANYTLIFSGIRGIIDSLIGPVQASIGNLLNSNNNKLESEKILAVYTFCRYIIANFCVSACVLLINPFIEVWVGEEYNMGSIIPVLMGIDLYIHIVHGALVQYIQGAGLFKEEKYITGLGALINLLFSICLVKKLGIIGVLIGTVVSQIFFWGGRSFIVFNKYYKIGIKKYILKNIYYIGVSILDIYVLNNVIIYANAASGFGKIIVNGLIIIVVNICITWIFFFRTYEMRYLLEMVKNLVKKIRIC